MKWFKHESRAHRDAKLQKLVMKYGFEGYGLYWYCVENVCASLEPNLTFELEVDSEILAHVGRMDSRLVEEIMLYMVNVGLFEQSESVITCLKLARFLGESGTRNNELREIIKREKSQTVSDGHRLSQTISDCLPKRREEKITKRVETNRFAPPTIEEIQDYCIEKGYHWVDPERFWNFYDSKNWMVGKNKMSKWRSSLSNWAAKDKPASSSEQRYL